MARFLANLVLRSWKLGAVLLGAVASVAAGLVLLPVTEIRPYCCIVDECEWIEGELSHDFKTSISRWPIPRYVSSNRETRMSQYWRWAKFSPEILHKYSADAAVAIFKGTPPDQRPAWWPSGPMTGDECCFMYPVALTERAWLAVPREKRVCRPNKGISPYWK